MPTSADAPAPTPPSRDPARKATPAATAPGRMARRTISCSGLPCVVISPVAQVDEIDRRAQPDEHANRQEQGADVNPVASPFPQVRGMNPPLRSPACENFHKRIVPHPGPWGRVEPCPPDPSAAALEAHVQQCEAHPDHEDDRAHDVHLWGNPEP